VQLGLVGHCAAQRGGGFADEAQSAEPGRPILVEVPEFVVGRWVEPGRLVQRDAANAARVLARPTRRAPRARRTTGRRITHSATTALMTKADWVRTSDLFGVKHARWASINMRGAPKLPRSSRCGCRFAPQ
jgi:hypothetical protein